LLTHTLTVTLISLLAHYFACSMSILIAELATNSIMGLKYALELRDQLIEKSQKLNLAGSVGLLQGLRKHGIHGIILTHRLIHLLTYLLTHSFTH